MCTLCLYNTRNRGSPDIVWYRYFYPKVSRKDLLMYMVPSESKSVVLCHARNSWCINRTPSEMPYSRRHQCWRMEHAGNEGLLTSPPFVGITFLLMRCQRSLSRCTAHDVGRKASFSTPFYALGDIFIYFFNYYIQLFYC